MTRRRLFSWNVNGLRACARKGFLEWLDDARPDILGLQEVRALPEQLNEAGPAPAERLRGTPGCTPPKRKGYSGVALYSPGSAPASVVLRRPRRGPVRRARAGPIVADYGDFLFYTGYFPQWRSTTSARVPYKLEFSEAVLRHAEAQTPRGPHHRHLRRRQHRPRGDRPRQPEVATRKNTGFLPEERAWVTRLARPRLHRRLPPQRHPERDRRTTPGWTNRPGVRERNVGWRIDYFFIVVRGPRAAKVVERTPSTPTSSAADHCPIALELDLSS
jgi:exodeoxyribonuclease-3